MDTTRSRRIRRWHILAALLALVGVVAWMVLRAPRPSYHRYEFYRALVGSDIGTIRILLRDHPEDAVLRYPSMGATPLHIAAMHANAEVIDALLFGGAKLEERAYRNQCTPLHCAALRGNVQAVTLLLDSGAEVDSKDVHGQTPLHYAAHNGHVEAIEVLVRRGADVNAVSSTYGRTPLAEAEAFGTAAACRGDRGPLFALDATRAP